VARVAAFIPDLLFGSNVVGALQAAGHEVQLVSDPAAADSPEVLIVDLTSEPKERLDQVSDTGAKTLAFYSHVEHEVRELAEAAGIDLVVPRSRMAREGPALVARLSTADQ
jgi:hypothetical protein